MELKPKYQYSYFIKPYIIEKDNYENYIEKLLDNQKLKVKEFERERDLDIYTYFLPNIRENIFKTFTFKLDEDIKSKKEKLEKILKLSVINFSYELDKNIEINEKREDGLVFGVNKIEIMCFNTGVCFLILKTYVDNVKEFCDILNFNYRFKEINSEFLSLKNFEKINLKVDNFEDIDNLKNVLYNITDNNLKNEIDDENFYVYSYACIDGEVWSKDSDFEKIKFDFYKFANLLQGNNNIDLNIESQDGMRIISKWDCARIGITKNSTVLLTSNINTFNYTSMPHKYENEYLYTFLISLYQRIYLKNLSFKFRNIDKLPKYRKDLNQFIKNIWSIEMTKDETGTLLYNNWRQTLEVENIYLEVMNVYDRKTKQEEEEKNKKVNKVLWIIVVICLIINLIDFAILMSIK